MYHAGHFDGGAVHIFAGNAKATGSLARGATTRATRAATLAKLRLAATEHLGRGAADLRVDGLRRLARRLQARLHPSLSRTSLSSQTTTIRLDTKGYRPDADAGQ